MFFLKYIVNYLKKYYRIERGPEFVDALRHLNHPSEVTVPNELIPAGVLMQLRGLFNLHTLSINNDWVWPYWIEQQFNPKSPSFIPRAMSLTYINLTHRNWTAVGVLGGTREAIVDPRGLVSPWLHGWSLDTWVVIDGKLCFPSRLPDDAVRQELRDNLPFVRTLAQLRAGLFLEMETWAMRHEDTDYIVHEAALRNDTARPVKARLAFCVRPYNPEGLSLVRHLAYNTKGFWNVDNQMGVFFPERPESSHASTHESGDISITLLDDEGDAFVHDKAGLSTGASLFALEVPPGGTAGRAAVMPVDPLNPRFFRFGAFTTETLQDGKQKAMESWRAKLDEGLDLEFPDSRYTDSFRANKAFLLLLNDGHEVTAGPLTYHRHWFRDAAYMTAALTRLGYLDDVARLLRFYPLHQWRNGYFCSQKGEWDSNGQAIWTILDHHRMGGGADVLRELYPAIRRGAMWIEKKRHDVTFSRAKPKGLLPAGFSAEHLGPNDFYYWDNFWGLAGVRGAVEAAAAVGGPNDVRVLEKVLEAYRQDVLEAINRDLEYTSAHVLPAAPRRRPDSGMIGNIAAAWPLEIFDLDSTPWLRRTVEFICDHFFHEDGFYQQMIHSGVNSYLTMELAQAMLMCGERDAFRLVEYMLGLATPTWCWPEAIHPRTLGGCMGDGHHGWAAAEWIMLLRNLVLREQGGTLHVTRLLPQDWFYPGKSIVARRAPTAFGRVDLRVEFRQHTALLQLQAAWRTPPREIHWHLPVEAKRVLSPAGEAVLAERMVIVPPSVTEVEVELRPGGE